MEDRKFIVKVYAYSKSGEKGYMYWTLSGSTTDVEAAHVFTDASVPPFFKQSLEQPYIEKIYI